MADSESSDSETQSSSTMADSETQSFSTVADSNHTSEPETTGDWDSDYRYEPNPLFEKSFQCLPFTKYKNPHLETGNKIIMPPSCLAEIVDSHLKWPLIFKMEGLKSDKISHCGVLEFEAEEGRVYMPEWMMENLNLLEGDHIVLRDASLSKGMFMKLRPHTASFVELGDLRAVLENKLRGFSCLSSGDTFMIKHGGADFYIDVLEVGPAGAVTLIDTDCTVEFAPALDSEEYEWEWEGDEWWEEEEGEGDEWWEEEEGTEFRPFTGRGRRLDGGEAAEMMDGGAVVEERESTEVGGDERREQTTEEEGREFRPFTGRGRRLDDGEAAEITGGGVVAEWKESTEVGGDERRKQATEEVVAAIGGGVVAEERKKSKEVGGEEEGKEEFKAFTGKSHVLGGI